MVCAMGMGACLSLGGRRSIPCFCNVCLMHHDCMSIQVVGVPLFGIVSMWHHHCMSVPKFEECPLFLWYEYVSSCPSLGEVVHGCLVRADITQPGFVIFVCVIIQDTASNRCKGPTIMLTTVNSRLTDTSLLRTPQPLAHTPPPPPLHPRYCRHQILVLRVSIIVRVDCI